MPFVTYGGICSGIALEEAGELLEQSGRKVLAGMKVAAAHNMTRAFMGRAINQELPGEGLNPVLDAVVEKIIAIDTEPSCPDQLESLRYQPREVAAQANAVAEKIWHEARYPKVTIDANDCIRCGKCVTVCPVTYLEKDSSGCIIQDPTSACIHCFNCVITCPVKAVKLQGDPERAKVFMANMMKNGNETPGTACLSNPSVHKYNYYSGS